MSSDCANCSNCYWKTPKACYAGWTQDQCANAGPDYVWCGSQPKPPIPPNPPSGCAQCSTCYSPSDNLCHTCYSQSQCTSLGYTWCGGVVPPPPPTMVNCCDGQGTCRAYPNTCPQPLFQVNNCQTDCPVKPNPPPPTTVNCCDGQGHCSTATNGCAPPLFQVNNCQTDCTKSPPSATSFCCDQAPSREHDVIPNAHDMIPPFDFDRMPIPMIRTLERVLIDVPHWQAC